MDDQQSGKDKTKPTKAYGGRSKKFWFLVYLVVAIVVYFIIYLIFFHKSGSSGY